MRWTDEGAVVYATRVHSMFMQEAQEAVRKGLGVKDTPRPGTGKFRPALRVLRLINHRAFSYAETTMP